MEMIDDLDDNADGIYDGPCGDPNPPDPGWESADHLAVFGLDLDPDPDASHEPDPGCYACRGTGSVIGFGARPGNQCPCTTTPKEY